MRSKLGDLLRRKTYFSDVLDVLFGPRLEFRFCRPLSYQRYFHVGHQLFEQLELFSDWYRFDLICYFLRNELSHFVLDHAREIESH